MGGDREAIRRDFADSAPPVEQLMPETVRCVGAARKAAGHAHQGYGRPHGFLPLTCGVEAQLWHSMRGTLGAVGNSGETITISWPNIGDFWATVRVACFLKRARRGDNGPLASCQQS